MKAGAYKQIHMVEMDGSRRQGDRGIQEYLLQELKDLSAKIKAVVVAFALTMIVNRRKGHKS